MMNSPPQGPVDCSKEQQATQMDRIYRYQRQWYDFSRFFFLLGRDRLIEHMPVEPGHNILEIGCGTARNCIKLARLHPECGLYGVDVSASMLEYARKKICRAGLDSRIKLAHASAETADYADLFGEDTHFSHIFFSYSLSMIVDWQAAINNALDALGPSGWLHIIDFGDLSVFPGCVGLLFRKWLAFFRVQPRSSLVSYLHTLNNELNGTLWLIHGRCHYSVTIRFHSRS